MASTLYKDGFEHAIQEEEEHGLILCFISESLNYPQCYRIVPNFKFNGPNGAKTVVNVIFFSLLTITLFICPILSECRGLTLNRYKFPRVYKKWIVEGGLPIALGVPKSESQKVLLENDESEEEDDDETSSVVENDEAHFNRDKFLEEIRNFKFSPKVSSFRHRKIKFEDDDFFETRSISIRSNRNKTKMPLSVRSSYSTEETSI